MSGIAEVLLASGFDVRGSDMASNSTTERLRKLGAKIFQGHRAEQVEGATCVVVSSAIGPSNPELVSAKQKGIPVIARAEMLAELMRLKMGIAVAGSHGKTTTTSMIGQVLQSLDPTVVVGGRLQHWNASSIVGKGNTFVVEADESDRSFLKFSPVYSVVTNIDREHMDTYRDLQDLEETFLNFLNKTAFFGVNWISADCPILQKIHPKISKPCLSYGFSENADLRITDVKFETKRSTFFVQRKNSNLKLGPFRLPVVGNHNLQNATAAIGIALSLGVGPEEIQKRLEHFVPADRRLQIHFESNEFAIIEDYGHHPTEIAATLRAISLMFPGWKKKVIFQPHRFTRTQSLWNEFASSFENLCDDLWLLPIYSAHENPIDGIHSEALAKTFRTTTTPKVNVVESVNADQVISTLNKEEVVLILGAGPLTSLAVQMARALNQEKRKVV